MASRRDFASAFKKKRQEWSYLREKYLLNILKGLKRSGKWSNGIGIRKDSWPMIIQRMNEKYPEVKSTSQYVRNHIFELKKSYRIVAALKEYNGFGWDESRNLPNVTDAAWADYVEVNPEAKIFRYTSFIHYEDMDELFRGSITDGKMYPTTKTIDNCCIPFYDDDTSIHDINEGTGSSDAPKEIDVEPTLSPSTRCKGRRMIGASTSTRSSKNANLTDANVIVGCFTEMVQLWKEANEIRRKSFSRYRPTYHECLMEAERMGLDIEDRIKLADLFRDDYNRVVFMDFNEVDRMIWARRQFPKLL